MSLDSKLFSHWVMTGDFKVQRICYTNVMNVQFTFVQIYKLWIVLSCFCLYCKERCPADLFMFNNLGFFRGRKKGIR